MPDRLRRELRTGVRSIDAEHREMLEQIRTLAPRLRQGKASVDVVFDALEQHIQRHFAHEEAMLRKVGYPGVEEHAAEHEKLRRYVAELRSQIERQGPGILEVTCRLLAGAVATHIEEHDRLFVPFLSRAVRAADGGAG